MITRGRKKQTAAARVPPTAVVSAENLVSEILKLVTPVRRTTRSSSKMKTHAVPAQKQKKVPVNPKVRKKIPVRKPTVTSDDEEFEDPMDPAIESEEQPDELESDLESSSELERLRQRLVELEKVPRNTQFHADAESTDRQKSSLPQKRCKPSEGRSLGTYNGKTDLDIFLVRLETCSRYFNWSESKKVFHLMNSLTKSASSILREVGPGGTLERILELLQVRFGNRAKRAKFLADLQNRKRRPKETLQELYLDLCESEPMHLVTIQVKNIQKSISETFLLML